MVLYFTGTGNSKYIAEKIAKALEMDIVSINKKIKTNDFTADLRLENTESCFGLDRKDKIQRMQKGIFCDELRR